jgi:hypothetical protein
MTTKKKARADRIMEYAHAIMDVRAANRMLKAQQARYARVAHSADSEEWAEAWAYVAEVEAECDRERSALK